MELGDQWHAYVNKLDPTSMENRKEIYHQQTTSENTLSNEILTKNETIPKHSHHQHNTAPQHLRLLQYGLKIPNHQHQQLNQTHHPHQQLASPLHHHVHQPQIQYQQTTTHKHQQSPQQFINTSNPSHHQQQQQQQLFQSSNQQQQQYLYQYQQPQPIKNTPPLYQTNQPPPLHPHSQAIQNSPQIWVPHQPPLHYHQQQQQQFHKTETQKPTCILSNPIASSSPQSIVTTKSSSTIKDGPSIIEKKRVGNNNHMRSPFAKRPLEAPVTMQGWLHKQGSEGLMLWKKRWFVLSEYCLFYYKGPEEEKLLGSILLPSYKVSICNSEDKVNKKFAFKCEHANMRTYILAADSQELMLQWIRVLNLACLLQTNVESDQQSAPSVPSTYNQSTTENSDSGFHQQFQQSQNSRTTPIHMHSSSNTTDFSNPSQQELSQYNQPLYANAPPKPRRLNDGSYSSPSPEILDRYPPMPQQQQPHNNNIQYLQPIHNVRLIPKSPPIHLYGHNHLSNNDCALPQSDYVQNCSKPNDYLLTNTSQNVERRTPDTYGRSKLTPTKSSSHHPSNNNNPTNYEDIYPNQSMYKRPLSPIAYNYVKKINPVYRTYDSPVNTLLDSKQDPSSQYNVAAAQLRKSPNPLIARPHSADFLEYELNHRQLNSNVLNKQQPRPKSSLDINRNTNDNDFYSEARYADKMRKSAQYLPKTPNTTRYIQNTSERGEMQQLKRPSSSSLRCPPDTLMIDSNYSLIESNIGKMQMSDSEKHQRPASSIRSRSVLSEGSVSRELDLDLKNCSINNNNNNISRKAINNNYATYNNSFNNYEENLRSKEFDQFSRSASARLSQNDGRCIGREGDRKREESMKRLLEWKQRMLQSPLNRKSQGNHKNYLIRPDLYYNKSQENDYIMHQNHHQFHHHSNQDVKKQSSVNNLPPQYNSYSSDDEEKVARSGKENVHSQAGRTLDNFPSNSESFTPAHTFSITVLDTMKEPDQSLITTTQSDTMHDNTQYTQSADMITVNNNNNSNNNDSKPEAEDSDSIIIAACDDNSTFTKPLIQFNKDCSNIAQVSNLRAEYSDQFQQSPVVTEIRSNGALVKSILAEFEKNSDQQDNESTEENYMTMTPKRNILDPRNSINSDATVIFNELIDENPYVEMNQTLEMSFHQIESNDENENDNNDNIDRGNDQRPYEMVCFQQGKLEPVYMELKHLDETTNYPKNPNEKLPDIIIPQQNNKRKTTLQENKSDSSDADDEASKDLDSLDTPSHPRFSLSDNFRPASYYLGASQIVQTEFPDSSDSEIVSPPPIPTTPPPMDEFDTIEQNSSTIEPIKRNHHTLLKFHTSNNKERLVNANKKYSIGGSTQSLINIKKQQKLCLSFTSLKDQADSSSIYSNNTDPERRFSSRLSHNSDSYVDLRVNLSSNSSYERMLKRRPVSEDFCDELDSIDNNFNDSLDKYLIDLQVSNDEDSHHHHHDYENLFILGQNDQKLDDTNNNNSTIDNDNDNNITSSTNTNQNNTSMQSDFNDFIQRGRPESSASTSLEISKLFSKQHSNRSTPSIIRLSSSLSVQEMPTISTYFSDRRDKSLDSSLTNNPAPYYYSDLSMNTSLNMDTTGGGGSSTILTLNNQRDTIIGNNKRDIMHIINPIKCSNAHMRNTSLTSLQQQQEQRNTIDHTFQLAAEARSVSVDFLNLTDKSGQIDKKNIYESDTLKRLKSTDHLVLNQTSGGNLYPNSQNKDKFNGIINFNQIKVRRSHSLEGLLENVLLTDNNNTNNDLIINQAVEDVSNNSNNNTATEGSYLWEEDSIWHERLRSASQRHTKSMDDLDCIDNDNKKVHYQRKSSRGIIRSVTYVNDNIYNMPFIQDKQQHNSINQKVDYSGTKNELKKQSSFLIDREKLRQWDLLSSAPSDDQLSTTSQGPKGNNTVVELGDGSTCEPNESTTNREAASGSVSINTRDTFPRAISTKKIWTPNTTQTLQSRSVTNLSSRSNEIDHNNMIRSSQQGYYMMNQRPSQNDLNAEQFNHYNNDSRKDTWQLNDKMNVSAGELLGRTHEELILLLIQLRRQSANTLQGIEIYYNEIDTIQTQLHYMDQSKRLENLQKLEQIKQHLIELEKQYEKSKPLVNLVDNMVKLGSLYRSPSNDRNNITPYMRDRIEFNQHIQERRLLAEEKRDWNRLNLNHLQLHEKVQQLYQLDRLIQVESETLQNLQQDKEDIERALGGLRHKLIKGFSDPAEIEQARKQQAHLENELSRVHLMLAQNSKKLEETVAGNARLEQELLVLKQKLQISRQQRNSPQFSNAGDSLPMVVGTSAMLESDLQKVQQKVGDLQKQRQELSIQVRQLTDRSNNLQQQFKPSAAATQHSINNNSSQSNHFVLTNNKKRVNSLWRETDLDTMNIIDHGELWDNQLINNHCDANTTNQITPLYINTDIKQNSASELDYYNRSDSMMSDDTIQTSNNNIPQEKQEIKTVRIVKRESERRQRDREKTITTTGKWDALLEEDDSSQNSSILFRPTSSTIQIKPPNVNNYLCCNKTSETPLLLLASSPNLPQIQQNTTDNANSDKSSELSPIFKSEAARQIITEMSSTQQDTPKQQQQTNRRTVPKEKRRHYTAPHNNLIMKSLNQLPTDDNDFDKIVVNNRRARDDLDMERALRQRIDTPDVVRSTLSNKEFKYNESTIDNILGTPNKINIPERYIPEQLPKLSAEEEQHRLRKVESIKKMLSDTTIISSSSTNINNSDVQDYDNISATLLNKTTTKMLEEKKQREHLLQLNQILAKQVMEMSKIVAVKALTTLPLQSNQISTEDEDSSPVTPLPLYQQRDNFYS